MKQQQKQQAAKDKFWWGAEEGEVHKTVFPYVAQLEEEQKEVQEAHVRHARLYSNDNVIGFGRTLKGSGLDSRPVARSSYNVIQQSVDTATAMIAKHRPKATFLTDGGDYDIQLKAELLDKFVYGIFESSGLYNESIDVFRDGAWSGHGVLKIFAEDSEIKVERVLIDEIITDPQECKYGKPRQIHQRRFVHKETLKARYAKDDPELARLIDKAQADKKEAYASFYKLDRTQIAIIESWHLPSSKGAKDGRHTITISNATLLDEDWKDDEFPFVFCRWHKPIAGFYGVGIAARLTGIQLRINKLLRFIDRMQDLMAKPRCAIDIASGVMKLQLTNSNDDIVFIPYRGKPPVWHTPQAVAAEIYQYVAQLKQEAFEFEGISKMQAHMQKPQDLESGKALREWHDLGADRQSLQAISFENLFKEAAYKIVKLAKKIYARNKKFTSVFRARSFIERIDWSEVDMDVDAFFIKVDVSSLSARTPAGRTQDVIDMMQANLISPEEGRRLLDHPDLEASDNLANAAIENIDRTIWNLRRGIYQPPEPFQHLVLGLKKVQNAYLQARDQGAPEDILQLFRNWLESAEDLQKKALEKAQQEMMAMQQPPPGMGGPPMGAPPPGAPPPGMEGMPPPGMEGMPPGGLPPEMAMAA